VLSDDDDIQERDSDYSPAHKQKKPRLKDIVKFKGQKMPISRQQIDPSLVGKGFPETYL